MGEMHATKLLLPSMRAQGVTAVTDRMSASTKLLPTELRGKSIELKKRQPECVTNVEQIRML